MDPPPLPPLPTTTTVTATAIPTTVATAAVHLDYPDSVDSSPRAADALVDNSLSTIPGGSKLRLMCSYGGHIIPRPHNKSLCYVGGESRLVVVDRHSSFSSIHSRLSRTLLNNRPFTLKYQLPNEDLDSLISVTTNEDLDNMIEEYDRTTSSSPLKPSRLRLFLFAAKPETAASMGSLLDDAKSETWFVDALNGSGMLPRGLSDSTMDCLLNLDEVRGGSTSDCCNEMEAQAESLLIDNKHVNLKNVQEMHSMPDSPMVVESTSSFGSSSSSPSMSTLPPIRVCVQDQNVGAVEEQFANFSVAQPPPPIPTAALAAAAVATGVTAVPTAGYSDENLNRVFSDYERSDQGVPVGIRKPPLPLQPLQPKAAAAGFCLPSPDSVASNSSIASADSFSKTMFYQDPVHAATRDNRGPPSPDPATRIQTQHQQLDHQQQQQFVHAPQPQQHYYYPMYAPQTQHQQQQYHYPVDQHYPVYIMPIPQTQPYNMSMHSNMPVASSRPLTPPSPAMNASPAIPETVASVYETAQFHQQQQYMGVPQMQHPHQSSAVPSAGTSSNYGFEYGHPPHDSRVFYTQHAAAAPLPPQYQTLTPAAAVAVLSDASKQLPSTDNTNKQQHIKTAQPL